MIRALKPGENFGEIALINDVKRTLSVRATATKPVKLLSLDLATFNRILGSIKQYLMFDYGE